MKKSAIIISFLISCISLDAQTSVSFQHLGNATFQNNLVNPSLIPEGKIFIGLPVLSGVHVNVNNKTSYNETFTREGDNNIVDVRGKILPELQRQNMASVKVNVNLLHIGYRLDSGPLLSFTINERIEGDFLYSKQLVDYVFGAGNIDYLNQDIKVNRVSLLASHFREFGLGIASPVNEQLTVGLRAKYLIGFTNVSTPGNAKADLRSDGEAFQIDADWKNSQFRTSGIDILRQENGFGSGDLTSHLIMNSNSGLALDFGGTYRLNRYYTLTGSIVDIGFINWKEDIDNEVLRDTTFRYNGIDLEELDNIEQTLEDSLFSRFDTDPNSDAYRTWLPVTAQGSWVYHYSPKTDLYVSVGSRYVQRQFKMIYGGGLTHKFGRVFTGSLSLTKLPQQFFNAGAAIVLKGGPVQMYMAADQVINFSVPDAKAFDFRFGMSFILQGRSGGRGESFGTAGRRINGAKGLDTNVFLGKKVKTKKRDGIYSIIKRQKKRSVKTTKTKRDGGVQKKSLNGRSGKKNTGNE